MAQRHTRVNRRWNRRARFPFVFNEPLDEEETDMRNVSRWLMVLVLLAGSFGIIGAASAQDEEQLRFVVVSHGQAADPFWSVVQRGTDQAGTDMGVEVEYQAPTTLTWWRCRSSSTPRWRRSQTASSCRFPTRRR
jgi:hypothetical protein